MSDELIEVHPRGDPIVHGDTVPGQIFVDAAALPGNGSPQIPFNRLSAGVDAAHDGDSIFIKAGSYPENLTITKSVTLDKWLATAGTVDIGR